MRLGTRWLFGASPPNSLGADVVEAVRAVEHSRRAEIPDSADGIPWFWTLTWLEGRPVCELDDGTRVIVSATGTIAITSSGEDDEEDDDSWMS
ncbi:hypothetical protein [Lysinibacter sp. HNR]|uniref:hypothetical protein n=1 Tax=Lysinibacter sp. HNR TaxID=3031408 RepID=UPI0024352A00|nr:hypothetical protein [Lysinibacter sp. HNR]WGD36371.1 hypothetical protein FrondiHNR_07730 [Lysinibacter sp. HNR]